MTTNYDFCESYILSQSLPPETRVLDYGCGDGRLVKTLRARGICAYGCDLFYEGGDRSRLVDQGLLGSVVRRMGSDCRIPFPRDWFDVIVNNQVMEHVENLGAVLAEIDRVLKSDGKVLSLFPDKAVWREGHCGIPFLHWFRKGSKARLPYAVLCRAFGLGYHKGNKRIVRWSKDFCDYLDRWTWYRDRNTIYQEYAQHLPIRTDLEHLWLQHRLGRWSYIGRLIPTPAQQWLVRKLGGLIFVTQRRSSFPSE